MGETVVGRHVLPEPNNGSANLSPHQVSCYLYGKVLRFPFQHKFQTFSDTTFWQLQGRRILFCIYLVWIEYIARKVNCHWKPVAFRQSLRFHHRSNLLGSCAQTYWIHLVLSQCNHVLFRQTLFRDYQNRGTWNLLMVDSITRLNFAIPSSYFPQSSSRFHLFDL